MTSINLEKSLEYLKIQESLRSENLTEYYLCKWVFLNVFLYSERYYTSTKQIIELAKTLRLFA